MAGENVIKNKIVLEGEAKYKKEMADISRALKEQKASLKAAAAEYDNAEGSMLAMYQQGDALERMLETQAQALRLMNEQLDKTEAAYGKNSREATELRTRISTMRAEMARTETQARQFAQRMDDAHDAMQDAGQGSGGAGDAIRALGQDAQDAEKDVGSLADRLKEMTGMDLKGLTLAGGAAAAGAAVGEGLKIGNEVLESWNQLAAYTGLTGDALERVKADAQAVYQSGVGDSLMDVTQATASIYQLTGQTGPALQDMTTYALALAETFGMDVGESARTAAVLMETFGISGRDAYDLIAAGAQSGADKNGNLLDTINEYAPYFKDAGKEADEMFSAIITGAQQGVYDVDKIGDAWKEFMLRVTSGDEGPKQALSDLGFAADDVTRKIAAGGDAADLATQEIIEALAKVEDPYEQNRLAIELFGTQWEDTSGKVLPIFEGMKTGIGDVKGTAEELAKVKYDDLDTAWQNLTRSLGALAEPSLAAGASALADTFDRWAAAVDRVAQGDWSGAFETLTAPSEEMQVQVEVAREASEGLREELEALDEQINEAFAGGDNVTGWTLEAQKQKLLEEIAQIETDAVAAMGEAGTATAEAFGEMSADMEEAAQLVGEEAVTAIEDIAPDMQTAGEEMGEEAVTAIEDAAPDMQDAGEEMGEEAVTAIEDAAPDMQTAGVEMGESAVAGLEAGSDGMYDAGKDAADGAVSGMGTGVSAAYSKGYAMGQAFERGYRAALSTHSPSRVMYEAAGDTTDGLFMRFDEDRQRLYDAAAGLGDAIAQGYAESGTGGHADAYGGADSMDAQELAGVLIQALSGMGVYCDGERMGELSERGASRATKNRLMATVRGQSSAVKGW